MADDKYRTRFKAKTKADLKRRGLAKDQAMEVYAQNLREYDARQGQVKGEGFLQSFGRSLVQPVAKSLKNIGAALYEGSLIAGGERGRFHEAQEGRQDLFGQSIDLAKQAAQTDDPNEKARLIAQSKQLTGEAGESPDLPKSVVGTPFLSEAEAQQISEEPGKAFVEQGLKPGAGTIAYGIPFGGATRLGVGLPQLGATAARQALLPGAVAGGLSAFARTPETATLGETAGKTGAGAGLGAVTAAVTTKVSETISNKITSAKQARNLKKQFIADARTQRIENARYLKPSDLDVASWDQENALQKLGTRTIANQQQVPAGLGRKVDINETARKMSDYGFPNADDWDLAASGVTGKNGLVTKMTRDVVGNADDVSTSELLSNVDDYIASEPLILPSQRKVLSEFIKREVIQMSGGPKGSLNVNANPQATFETIQNLEAKAASITNGRPPWSVTAEERAVQKVLYMTKAELTDRLFEPSLVDKAGRVVLQRGNANAQLVDTSTKYAPQLARVPKALAGDIQAAQTVGQLRNVARPFVGAAQVAREALATGGSPFYNFATNRPQGLAKLLGIGKQVPGLEAVLGSRPVTAQAGQFMRAFGSSGAGRGLVGVPGQVISGTLGAVSKGVQSAGRNIPGASAAISPVLLERINAFKRAQAGQ